ncbi:hypothetical protein [Chitinophaga sp. Cy-1792]|uniref:hypothetical protein n=1 Tax=Chitinophaga sp. Cy-1792 TaxID=2608339 RepID=UPI00142233C2|nr:hypothetical protein [Chitinophaga sp. Cy-1792]NIG56722.1 hypothetical protein [Chitinophaga sp. Cy-1792]
MNPKVFICGNGNLSFPDYIKYYQGYISKLLQAGNPHFILGDFRGVDTLTMEMLKCATPNVTLLHMGKFPRYMPDKFRTMADQWEIIGGFQSNYDRDMAAIDLCTHFLAIDFNTDHKRKSGTLINIETCRSKNKMDVTKMTW